MYINFKFRKTIRRRSAFIHSFIHCKIEEDLIASKCDFQTWKEQWEAKTKNDTKKSNRQAWMWSSQRKSKENSPIQPRCHIKPFQIKCLTQQGFHQLLLSMISALMKMAGSSAFRALKTPNMYHVSWDPLTNTVFVDLLSSVYQFIWHCWTYQRNARREWLLCGGCREVETEFCAYLEDPRTCDRCLLLHLFNEFGMGNIRARLKVVVHVNEVGPILRYESGSRAELERKKTKNGHNSLHWISH